MSLYSSPSFGNADLTNCEREQIHLAGSIQPHGALLIVREPDFVVVQASANASELINYQGDVLGVSLSELDEGLWTSIRPYLNERLTTIPTAVRCRVGNPVREFDSLLHRPPDGGGIVVELEAAAPGLDITGSIDGALGNILSCVSLQPLCDEMARVIRKLTDYDRVMVYRFDKDGHGEVFSESRLSSLDPFLGQRYPASDIPQIARRLYERNRIRLLVDVEYTPVPLAPERSPLTGDELDMSHCFLRSMSPIHIQYLKNMGVCATLVISVVVGGELWGLIACHHYKAKNIHYELRVVCELLAEAFATRIAALEIFAQSQSELVIKHLERRLITAIHRDGDWRSAVFDKSQSLLKSLNASGAALLFEGDVLSTGDVPGTQDLWDIAKWLDKQPKPLQFESNSLGTDSAAFSNLVPVASGLLATTISNDAGEYLFWFRKEQVRTVKWGGNPHKPVVVGNDPADLSPRRSFAQWHQLVEGTSAPWTPADITSAQMIGESLTDIVMQFRAVRMLIIQDQLQTLERRVQVSEHPVIIADAQGNLLFVDKNLGAFLDADLSNLKSITALQQKLSAHPELTQSLELLLKKQRAFHKEIELKNGSSKAVNLLIRADPIYASPESLLGYVILFNDLSQKQAADSAREAFQATILEKHRFNSSQTDATSNPMYRSLIKSILGNAQLAAMEITESASVSQVSKMLDNVSLSVDRSAQLLEHLIYHVENTPDDNGNMNNNKNKADEDNV